MSLPAIIGAFFTEIGNFGASEMTAGLGFTYVFAMIIAGFAGCLVIRNTIAMTQNIKITLFCILFIYSRYYYTGIKFCPVKGRYLREDQGGEP